MKDATMKERKSSIKNIDEIKQFLNTTKSKKPIVEVDQKIIPATSTLVYEISKNDFDDLVKWIMENHCILSYSRPDVEYPDVYPDIITFLDYEDSARQALYELTNCWSYDIKSFLDGQEHHDDKSGRRIALNFMK